MSSSKFRMESKKVTLVYKAIFTVNSHINKVNRRKNTHRIPSQISKRQLITVQILIGK
jgi:hypothetical protein